MLSKRNQKLKIKIEIFLEKKLKNEKYGFDFFLPTQNWNYLKIFLELWQKQENMIMLQQRLEPKLLRADWWQLPWSQKHQTRSWWSGRFRWHPRKSRFPGQCRRQSWLQSWSNRRWRSRSCTGRSHPGRGTECGWGLRKRQYKKGCSSNRSWQHRAGKLDHSWQCLAECIGRTGELRPVGRPGQPLGWPGRLPRQLPWLQ